MVGVGGGGEGYIAIMLNSYNVHILFIGELHAWVITHNPIQKAQYFFYKSIIEKLLL